MRYLRHAPINKHRSIILLLAMLVLLFAGYVSAASVPGVVTKSKSTEKKVQVPENMAPEEVDAFLAGISDTEARQVLARKLKQEAADISGAGATGDTPGKEDAMDHFFHKLTLGASLVLDQIASFMSTEEEGAVKWGLIIGRLSGGRGIGHLLLTLLIGLGIIACGLVVERLVRRLTGNL